MLVYAVLVIYYYFMSVLQLLLICLQWVSVGCKQAHGHTSSSLCLHLEVEMSFIYCNELARHIVMNIRVCNVRLFFI